MTATLTIVSGATILMPEGWQEMSIDDKIKHPYAQSIQTFFRKGRWKKEGLINLARKYGFVGSIKISYHTRHCSGCDSRQSAEFEVEI